MNEPGAPRLLRLWLAFNAGCIAAGWLLSAFGLLTTGAYVGLGILGLAAAGYWWHRDRSSPPLAGRPALRVAVWRRRLRRPAAATFALLCLAAGIGGLLHAPNNVDALAYRTPRVLHWLAEQQWHWIHAPYQRLNTRACGFEWLTTPFLAVFHSDRGLFLLNLASFALLPGLTFTVLRRSGVGGRAAATWMWLFPGAYCFALQAGSIGNDLYGSVLALAALAFAWRARTAGRVSDAGWSLLAAALMTGAKSSNLPLLLPWLVAWWPGSAAFRRQLGVAVPVAALGALVSLLPICALNQRYAGDWTGLSAEDAWIRPPGPVASALHNVGLMTVQNLLPPILPGARAVNERIESLLPEAWKVSLDGFAENGRHSYAVRELPGEEHAGLGFGVSLLLLLLVVPGLARGGWRRLTDGGAWRTAVLVLPFVALGPYFAKSGITTAGRILAPYYGWLLPALLLAGQADRADRARWFRTVVMGISGLVLILTVVLPTRPLWPALTFLEPLAQQRGGSFQRAFKVYSIYAQRADPYQPLRVWLPPDPGLIGLVTGNDAETALWKPFGTRRVWHLLPQDALPPLRARGLSVVVANTVEFTARFGTDPALWARDHGAVVAGRVGLQLLASQPPQEFVVLRWPDSPIPPPVERR